VQIDYFPALSKNYIIAPGRSCFYVYDNGVLYSHGLECNGELGGKGNKSKLTEMSQG
jgi:hypothetical protein